MRRGRGPAATPRVVSVMTSAFGAAATATGGGFGSGFGGSVVAGGFGSAAGFGARAATAPVSRLAPQLEGEQRCRILNTARHHAGVPHRISTPLPWSPLQKPRNADLRSRRQRQRRVEARRCARSAPSGASRYRSRRCARELGRTSTGRRSPPTSQVCYFPGWERSTRTPLRGPATGRCRGSRQVIAGTAHAQTALCTGRRARCPGGGTRRPWPPRSAQRWTLAKERRCGTLSER